MDTEQAISETTYSASSSAIRGRIATVFQMGSADCGAACLAMALRAHGRHVTLEEVRHVVGPGTNGSNLNMLATAAEHFGLTAEPVAADAEGLRLLPRGSILHWDESHYVVLDRLLPWGVRIVDPASGRRTLRPHTAAARFSRSALALSKGPRFVARSRAITPLRRLRDIAKSAKGTLGRLLGLSLVVQLLGLAGPYLTSVLVDRIVPKRDYHLLFIVVSGLATFVGFQFVTTFVRSRLLLRLRVTLDAELTRSFMDHLLKLPLGFFQRHTTGDLLGRAQGNATIRGMLTSSVISGTLDATMTVVYFVILFRSSGTLTILVLLIAAIYVLAQFLARRARRARSLESLRAQAHLQNYDVEMLVGIEALKAMGVESEVLARWTKNYDTSRQTMLRQGRVESWMEASQTALRVAVPLAILTSGTLQVLSGRLTLGRMLGLNAIAIQALAPLAGLASLANTSAGVARQVERLDDVLSEPIEFTPNKRRALEQRLSGTVTLERVSFRYGPLLPHVVSDVSLDIGAASLVAIVGPSGSGKSTLARLLLGLYVPTAGRVLYDGVDLNLIDLRWLRRQFGVVTQQPHLFADTVAANIVLGRRDISGPAMIAAAKKAGIHDEIMRLPHGYDTTLTSRGSSLSGGQQQRIAIARALAGNPRILLLDEATNQLDGITETQVWNTLTPPTRTTVVIAHRLNTVTRADCVVVMDRGRAVAVGRHDDLLESSGMYAQLVQSQGASVSSALA